MVAPRKTYRILLGDGRALQLGARTLVMGVLNVTPDSFADGGRHFDSGRAIDAALRMEADGADIIDVGAESTRPGADPVTPEEEVARLLPVLRGLAGRVRAPISVDTYKAAVARIALEEGAAIVNDVSGLRYDPALRHVVATARAPLVLMHTRGRSREMYREAIYDDAVTDVVAELSSSLEEAVAAGIARDAIILDPGIGFAKRAEHSARVLARLEALSCLDRPLLVGPSRKSFLQAALGKVPADERDWGTAAAVTASVLAGAHVVRVHAIRPMVDVVRTADLLRAHGG